MGGSSAVLALVPVSALVVAVVEVTTVAAAPLVPVLESQSRRGHIPRWRERGPAGRGEDGAA